MVTFSGIGLFVNLKFEVQPEALWICRGFSETVLQFRANMLFFRTNPVVNLLPYLPKLFQHLCIL